MAGYFPDRPRVCVCVYICCSFFGLDNKKNHNIENDSAASSGGQGKYVKYVNFPWPPLEAALPVFNVSLFYFKTNFKKD